MWVHQRLMAAGRRDGREQLARQAREVRAAHPFVDAPLDVLAHFARFQGARVWVELNVARDGRRRYTGTLAGVHEQGITLEVDGEDVSIGFGEVGKARLVA